MKMNATKLTIALVALLLALTCVFAACGKKNNTDKPDDTTPVDNTPVAVDTVAKEDLTAVAESLKAAYAANYVDLYSAETATAIEAEKSAALVKIMAATSKEEAQKVADDFIAFLKSQKTIINSIAALVEKIGDVSLNDADALNELSDVVATLDAAYAGTNAAKKAALDAYKADAATQKTIKDIVDRYDELKAAKKAADAKDGINAQIADLKADFTKADKEFALSDFNKYDTLSADIAALAKKYSLEAGSEAYKSVIDTATLEAAKAALDAAFAKDPILAKLQALVDAAAALEKAADAAQLKEKVYIDASKLAEKQNAAGTLVEVKLADGTVMFAAQAVELFHDNAGTHTTAVTFADGAKMYYDNTSFDLYGTEDDVPTTVAKTALVVAPTDEYKLALKADVEKAQEAYKAVFDFYDEKTDLTAYGYVMDDPTTTTVDEGDGPAYEAKKTIERLTTAYTDSVVDAKADYAAYFISGTYTDVKLKKNPTTGTYSLQAEFDEVGKKIQKKDDKVGANQTLIADSIDTAKENFVSRTAGGNPTAGGDFYVYYTSDAKGGYDYKAKTGNYGFNLVDGVPAIDYVAWSYRYDFDGKEMIATGTPTAKQIKYSVFDAVKTLNVTTLQNAKNALRWLTTYIGDGDYAESYNLYEYKDYATFAKTDILYMTDRAVTEVAVPGVVEIRGNAVNVAKNEEVLAAKVLSPYTMAKALVAEDEKIQAAKDEAVEAIKAAGLALRAAGDADAVIAAKKLLTDALNGEYVNEKLGYELDLTLTANAGVKAYFTVSTGANITEVALQSKPSEIKKDAVDIINKAYDALKDAVRALVNSEAAAKTAATTAGKTYVTLVDLLNAYGKKLATIPDPAVTADGYLDGYVWDDPDDDPLTTATYTVKSIKTYADQLKALEDYSKMYQDYIAEATRRNNVAKAGVAAYVMTKTTDSLNRGSDDTAKDLKKVNNLATLFNSYDGFEFNYTNYLEDSTSTAITAGLGLKNATLTSVKAVLDRFQGDYEDDDHDDLCDFVKDLLASIIADPTDPTATKIVAQNSKEFVEEYKAKAEKNFEDYADAYKGVKGITASNAYAASAAIGTAKTSVLAFANNYLADYVNLKVTVALGDEKFDYDFLTEVFRETMLANSQKVIGNIVGWAGTVTPALTADITNTAGTGVLDSWKAAVAKRVDSKAVAFDVTSISAAEKNVAITNLDANDYNLSGAAKALKDAYDAESKTPTSTIDAVALKTAGFHD